MYAAGEWCETQTFEAQCDVNQVVVMKSAKYGRMRLGKCVQQNFGDEHQGCNVDVMGVLDAACSGRNKCSISVFQTLRQLKPCSELECYLEATYECVPGKQGRAILETILHVLYFLCTLFLLGHKFVNKSL